ncbi:hypothetical protein PYJP_08220 [Pyrofollis japonicus]|uniref:DNA double-strand break repair nuclease NurA n=1 Tax=Pyrofollis japonicus TaxID=3060460 RepID=UPI00295C1AA7|nr:DNA double-strand break repair nuclease NurA [Pyrofollis japonicus]BEP17470.1 hypothetical protein PYJP_08220 [Pyrofollis japonicus]
MSEQHVAGSEDELYQKLVEKAVSRLRQRIQGFRNAIRDAESLIRSLREKGLFIAVRKYRDDLHVAGLDGSRQVIRSGLGRYLVLAATALVELPSGMRSEKVNISYPGADAYEVHDPSGFLVDSVAEAGMLLLETLSLREALSRRIPVLMLDGPIIDPPTLLPEEAWTRLGEEAKRIGITSNQDFHELRSKLISELVYNGAAVIGIVKRISGEHLLSSVIPKEYEVLRDLSDDEILVMLSNIISGTHVCIGPFTPVLTKEIINRYEARGLRIITYYTFSRGSGRPLRVEVAISDGEDQFEALEDTAQIVQGLIMPGHHVPLAVQLAHEKSHIPRSVATLIYREALTRLAAEPELASLVAFFSDEAP